MNCYGLDWESLNSDKGNLFIEELPFPEEIFKSLHLLADILYAKAIIENNTSELLLSLDTYSLAQQLIDTVRLGIFTEGDKLHWMADQNHFYNAAINCAYQLYNCTEDKSFIETAFQFTEKSKANVLYEHIQSQEALKFSHVDSSSIALLRDISEEITFIERQLYEGKLQVDSSNVQQLKNNLFTLKERKISLKREIQLINPEYYKLSYDLATSKISNIQKDLESDQNFVSYFEGDTSLFAFYITPKIVELYNWGKHRELGTDIKHFRETISIWPQIKMQGKKDSVRLENEVTYAKLGYSLYKQVLGPLLSFIQSKQRLLIVPHGDLYYLPFDALLTDSVKEIGDYSRYPYLFFDNSLSINYSATLWQEMHRPTPNKKLKPLLGMALDISRRAKAKPKSILLY